MSLSADSHISLIDLNRQLPFSIDEDLKAQLCFAETLIVSCAHYEGNLAGTEEGNGEENGSGSVWTCTETSQSEVLEEVKQEPFEIKDQEEVPEDEHSAEEDNDFHFYFFPDCKKAPPPQHSQQSLILVDGLPQINQAAVAPMFCSCDKDREGKCTCNVIIPCKCGAKTKQECKCAKLEEICICDDTKPTPTCVCGKGKVCTCFPGLPRPVCTCGQVDKPCICHKDKFPCPVCLCKHKPKHTVEGKAIGHYDGEGAFILESNQESRASFEGGEEFMEELDIIDSKKSSLIKIEEEENREPCECQKPDPKQRCLCIKGNKCICLQDSCICGVQKTCVCESSQSSDPNCIKEAISDSLCECPIPRECTCDAKEDDCTCFPKMLDCTCGDPENCKCKKACDCLEPCICDTMQKVDECLCLDKSKQIAAGLVCTCPFQEEKAKKLKKVRAGKHGYRWCHDVDPYHTFFDYAYGRHDMILDKEQQKEKFKILGIYDEKEDVCPVHGTKTHTFEKKVRKPSLDCCSSLGGITITVETLGEDADKFLVQVVSYASKEGAKTGSKLVSIVDLNLHTLEENRMEHITKKERTKECKSYMAICQNGYFNKVTRNCAEKHVVKRLYHTFEQAKDFLLEGSNVVLLRYFGIRRYKGTVKTVTVLMDGTVCESVYVCPGVSQAIVNGKPLFVVKVERHIIEPNGFIHQTLTVLSLRGYMISHEWADNNYVLHINPLLNIIPEKDEIEKHAPLRDRWREDLQLLSDFLDYKTTRSSEGARYIAENGKLTSTVRDYLQAILMLRPLDVVHFTRHYFHSALSSLDLPRDEYFDPCPKHVRYYYLEE